jgi:hypothetical protein
MRVFNVDWFSRRRAIFEVRGDVQNSVGLGRRFCRWLEWLAHPGSVGHATRMLTPSRWTVHTS